MPKPYGKEYIAMLNSKPKSSDRNDILNWLYNTGLVKNYIKRLEYKDIDEETLNDEIQEVWLMICEIPQDKWDNLFIQGTTPIKAFISGLIFRQIHSNSSPVYNKLKKQYTIEKHLSEKCWDVYDETGEMMQTNDSLLLKETTDDLIYSYIENNQTEKLLDVLYEKRQKTKSK